MRGNRILGVLLVLGLLAAALGIVLSGGERRETPHSGRTEVGVSRPPSGLVVRLAPLPASDLRAAHPPRKGQALRFADPARVSLSPENDGRWLVDGDTATWRLAIEAPGALNLNLAFVRYGLPEGAVLEFLAPDGTPFVRSFTAADVGPDGDLWTPVFAGERVELRLSLPTDQRGALDLELAAINRGFRDLSLAAGRFKIGSDGPLGDCHLDVVCPAGHPGVASAIDAYRDQIRSVGAFTLEGMDTCSGALVNNTALDGTPYFLTAQHCGVTAGNASSMVVYWNFQHSTCRTPNTSANGLDGDGPLTQFSNGARFRAAHVGSDMALVELTSAIDPSWNLHYAGWSRSASAPRMAVAVHHPNLSEKRISFEMDPLQSTDDSTTSTNPAGLFWRVIDWDFGTTEGGSSGSPLFNQDGHIVGQLSGGFAACGNNESDWYGKFDRGWTGGGSASSRLRDWLDPVGSNVVTLEGTDGAGVGASIADASLEEGDEGTSLMRFTVRLTDPASELIRLRYSTEDGTAVAGEDFVGVTNATVSIAAGQVEGEVTVAVNGDVTPEENETFGVIIEPVAPSPVIISSGTATGRILNDDFLPPVVTGPVSVSGRVGRDVDAVVTAQNTPTSFTLSDEPEGMTVDSSGRIRWVPTVSGTYRVTVTAMNAAGESSARIFFIITDDPLGGSVESDGSYALRTGGTAEWVRSGNINDAISGGDRAQSGTVSHNQQSWLEAEVMGPDYVGFWWKVESERNFDFLELSVDGELRDRISGFEDWSYRVLAIGPGLHTVRWSYIKDQSESDGLDAGWVDLVQVASSTSGPFLMDRPAIYLASGQPAAHAFASWSGETRFSSGRLPGTLSLAEDGLVTGSSTIRGESAFSLTMSRGESEITIPATVTVNSPAGVGSALDQPDRLWWRSGTGSWEVSSTSRVGGTAVKESGVLANGRGSISTVVTGPGAVSFWWQVSSEQDFDGLVFEVNGAPVDMLTGEAAWQRVTHSIGFGTHVLSWTYQKDDTVSEGQDTGWVDGVTLEGYAGWVAAQGLGGAGNPRLNRDGDEVDQWFEYVSGGSATEFDAAPRPQLVGGALEWSLSKPVDLRDVFLDVEVSGDLVDWGTSDRTILQDDAVRFRARDQGGAGSARRFLRVLSHPTR